MRKFWVWRIIYGVCCLVYLGWIMQAGGNEFDRVNSQYRRVAAELDSGRLRTAALEELIAECRKESTIRSGQQVQDCSSMPSAMIEARAEKIEHRLVEVRERVSRKRLLFYAGFTVVFLLAPPVMVYLLIVGAIRVFKIVKVVR